MTDGSTKEYHFIRNPQYGDIVKVYVNKTEHCYGRVCGYFTRNEHRNKEITTAGKEIPAYDIITDCVLLVPVETVRFNQIEFFLSIERVDFKTV